MEIILYFYFAINLMLLGSYLFDRFNDDKWFEKLFISVIIFFFGVILVLWELTLAHRFEYWFNSSEFGFWYKLNIRKTYDNLEPEALEYIKGQISREKENKDKESQKLVKHLTKILKRNGR